MWRCEPYGGVPLLPLQILFLVNKYHPRINIIDTGLVVLVFTILYGE